MTCCAYYAPAYAAHNHRTGGGRVATQPNVRRAAAAGETMHVEDVSLHPTCIHSPNTKIFFETADFSFNSKLFVGLRVAKLRCIMGKALVRVS